jgi:hypothetical protein
MTALMIGYAVALIFGFIGSFVMIQQKGQRVIEEVKLGTVLFIVICTIWLATDNINDSGIIFELTILWVVLITGIGLGDLLHRQLTNHLTKQINKENIEYQIKSLVYSGRQVCMGNHPADVQQFLLKSKLVQTYLQDLMDKSKHVKDKNIPLQIDGIIELVEEYTTLITSVIKKTEGKIIRSIEIGSLGSELVRVTQYALDKTEQAFRSSLFSVIQMRNNQSK